MATHLVLLVVGDDLFKKAEESIVSHRIGMKLDRDVLEVNAHQLAESDF